MTTWVKTTEKRYDEMLGVVSPIMTSIGFLVGEPMDRNEFGRPRYSAFVRKGDEFFEAKEVMTLREFRAVRLEDVHE